jgi:DNA polymerase-4
LNILVAIVDATLKQFWEKIMASMSLRDNMSSNLMDKINQKYGAEAIRLGVSPKTQAGYVGTKIAFHRIPDMEEFNE